MSAAPLGLSTTAARRFRRVTVATVLALALAAAVLSFSGLYTLAIQAGFPEALAWLLPVIIDGLVITGSLGVIAATLVGVSTWYPWALTILGVVASTVGNVLAAPTDLVSQVVHATPPITFALAVEGLLRVYRIGAEASVDPRPTRATASAALTPVAAAALVSPSRTAPTPDPTPDRTPVPAAAAMAPATHAGTARDRLVALLRAEPNITGGDAARRLGIDPSHARRLLRELRASQPTDPLPGS